MSTPPSGPRGPDFEPPAPSPGQRPAVEPAGAPQPQPGVVCTPLAGEAFPGAPLAGAPLPGAHLPSGSYTTWHAEPPAAAAPERVVLGLVAAAAVVLVCSGLTAASYQWGFIASITAWLMAVGATWAYRRSSGEPVRGRVPLLMLIVAGVAFGFLAMVASAVWGYYWAEMGSAGTIHEALRLVAGNLFNGELWRELGSDALFYFLFAALGVFGVIRRMSGMERAKA